MNRRGFIGALTGLPIAAVVMPKVSVPEVTASPATSTTFSCGSNITYTIHGPLLACDRDTLALAIGDSVTRTLHAGRPVPRS